MHSVNVFTTEIELNTKNYGKRASYSLEINKIVTLLNSTLGNTWSKAIKKKSSSSLKFGNGSVIPENKLPWKLIKDATDGFDQYLKSIHGKIFEMDPSFSSSDD